MKLKVSFLILASMIVASLAGDDNVTIVPTDKICKICQCEDKIVNCNDKKLDTFFTVADWAGVASLVPKKIILSNNKFTEVTPFSELPLLTLDLSNGNIQRIQDSAFLNLQAMRALDLSHNALTSDTLIPSVFNGPFAPEKYHPLKSLKSLNLSYNNLHSLDQDLFEHIRDIEELRLKGNPFTLIDHSTVVAISSLLNLKILDFSECKLKNFPEYFLHTPKYLEWLDISANELTKVPGALEEATSVTFLNISNNPIKIIERNTSSSYTPFYRMPSLVELHMSHMPVLTEIGPTAMSGLTKLQTLHLNYNPQLRKIDASAFVTDDADGEGKIWPEIKNLYLNKNNISVLDVGLLSRWDLIEEIDIRHNPYMCDCTTQWMTTVLVPVIMAKDPKWASDIICNEPIEMRGKSIIHLEEIHYQMRCVDKYGDRPEKDGMFLVGTLIGVLITVPVILGIILLLKRGYFGICGEDGPAAYSRQFYKRADTNDFI